MLYNDQPGQPVRTGSSAVTYERCERERQTSSDIVIYQCYQVDPTYVSDVSSSLMMYWVLAVAYAVALAVHDHGLLAARVELRLLHCSKIRCCSPVVVGLKRQKTCTRVYQSQSDLLLPEKDVFGRRQNQARISAARLMFRWR